MQIRKLIKEDAILYRELRLKALQYHPDAFGSSYEEEKGLTANDYGKRFGIPEAITLGAFEEEKLVGVVTLVIETKVKLKHRATIFAMYVAPSHRGQKIGQLLMEAVINEARKFEEIEQIYLTVVTTNQSAKKLYTAMGFEVFGLEKRALKLEECYLDEEHMVLFLN
ncbi:GNAT family N-acetyltransferase [Metabacillus herbersteinensis]|uniref:GNAT family N-acetyltransferase n=1 Tax=Metabacillus herbersteinensis TaxID=283816 RepID=A0ABV6GAA1_9BACI